MSDASNPRPSAWEKSFTRCIVRALTAKKFWKIAISLIVLGIILFAVDHFTGQRTWHRYLTSYRDPALLEFATFIPPPVERDQNFVAIDFFQQQTTNDMWSPGDLLDRTQKIRLRGNFNFYRYPLASWAARVRAFKQGTNTLWAHEVSYSEEAETLAAPEILEALQSWQPVWNQLSEAHDRPWALHAINYSTKPSPAIDLHHLVRLRALMRRLALRTRSHLALKQRDLAFESLTWMVRLTESLDSDPFLNSHIVSLSSWREVLNEMQAGLAHWDPEQSAWIQKKLKSLNLQAALRQKLLAEKAFILKGIEDTRLGKDALMGGRFDFLPSSWFRRARTSFAMTSDELLGIVDANEPGAARLEKGQSLVRSFKALPWRRKFLQHEYFNLMLVPVFDETLEQSLRMEHSVKAMQAAFALERWRRNHASLPDSLSALAPHDLDTIPLDVMDHHPLKFKKMGGNEWILYSVGPNGKDDGGSRKRVDGRELDWVLSSRLPE